MILTGIYNRMREYLCPQLRLFYSLRQCFQAKRVDGLTWCSQVREQRQEGHFSSPSGKRLCTDNKTNEFSVVNPEWNILLPLWAHHVWWCHSWRETLCEWGSKHTGTMIGLFLTCFINQRKSFTNWPPSSGNDQHLVSPYIIHCSLKHKGYKNGIRAMVTRGKMAYTF